MALTDQAQKLLVVAGGKVKEVKDGLADPDKRTAYMEAGRAAAIQGVALVTDKAATARTLAGQGWSKTTRTVEDILTPPPVWDTTSTKARAYAVATSTREQARTAKNKGIELVQEHGPKITVPVRSLGRKASKVSRDKAPVAKGIVFRNREEIMLALAVINVIIAGWRIIAKRRGHK